MAFVMDNATNNDTMIEEIEFWCQLGRVLISLHETLAFVVCR